MHSGEKEIKGQTERERERKTDIVIKDYERE